MDTHSYLLDNPMPPHGDHPILTLGPRVVGPSRPIVMPAVVESMDEAAATAYVRLRSAPDALLLAHVSEALPMELIHEEDPVLVVSYGDNLTVLIAPYQRAHSWPVHARAETAASQAFTAQSYTAWADLEAFITLRETSYLWMLAQFSAANSAARSPVAFRLCWFVDGVAVGQSIAVGQAAANLRIPLAMSQRSADAYGPGVHALQVRCYVETAGDTTTLYQGVASVFATPD